MPFKFFKSSEEIFQEEYKFIKLISLKDYKNGSEDLETYFLCTTNTKKYRKNKPLRTWRIPPWQRVTLKMPVGGILNEVEILTYKVQQRNILDHYLSLPQALTIGFYLYEDGYSQLTILFFQKLKDKKNLV